MHHGVFSGLYGEYSSYKKKNALNTNTSLYILDKFTKIAPLAVIRDDYNEAQWAFNEHFYKCFYFLEWNAFEAEKNNELDHENDIAHPKGVGKGIGPREVLVKVDGFVTKLTEKHLLMSYNNKTQLSDIAIELFKREFDSLLAHTIIILDNKNLDKYLEKYDNIILQRLLDKHSNAPFAYSVFDSLVIRTCPKTQEKLFKILLKAGIWCFIKNEGQSLEKAIKKLVQIDTEDRLLDTRKNSVSLITKYFTKSEADASPFYLIYELIEQVKSAAETNVKYHPYKTLFKILNEIRIEPSQDARLLLYDVFELIMSSDPNIQLEFLKTFFISCLHSVLLDGIKENKIDKKTQLYFIDCIDKFVGIIKYDLLKLHEYPTYKINETLEDKNFIYPCRFFLFSYSKNIYKRVMIHIFGNALEEFKIKRFSDNELLDALKNHLAKTIYDFERPDEMVYNQCLSFISHLKLWEEPYANLMNFPLTSNNYRIQVMEVWQMLKSKNPQKIQTFIDFATKLDSIHSPLHYLLAKHIRGLVKQTDESGQPFEKQERQNLLYHALWLYIRCAPFHTNGDRSSFKDTLLMLYPFPHYDNLLKILEPELSHTLSSQIDNLDGYVSQPDIVIDTLKSIEEYLKTKIDIPTDTTLSQNFSSEKINPIPKMIGVNTSMQGVNNELTHHFNQFSLKNRTSPRNDSLLPKVVSPRREGDTSLLPPKALTSARLRAQSTRK